MKKLTRRPVFVINPSKIYCDASLFSEDLVMAQHEPESSDVDEEAVRETCNFGEPEIGLIIPSAPDSFGETETGNPPPDTIEIRPSSLVEAIDQCANFDGAGFFANRRDRRVEMTGMAYVLFPALQAGGDAAFEMAVARIPPGLRQRAPSRTKLALLAVQLTAKPATVGERKTCSAYASLLVVAHTLGITSEGYRKFAFGIDLADAEVQAKKIRAALKASAPYDQEDDKIFPDSVFELQMAIYADGKPKDTVRLSLQYCKIEDVRQLFDCAKVNHDLAIFTAGLALLCQNN